MHSDSQFIDRICVNFIRHTLTNYDYSLEQAAGKVGVVVAVNKIRGKVYSEIANTYPIYANECKRQLYARSVFS